MVNQSVMLLKTKIRNNNKSQRHSVTLSRPENDVNITGNGEADKEIAKEALENDKKLARDGVTKVTVALQEKPSIYRIGNTDQFGCNGCKLRGDKWFMQEHTCKGLSKSKVADMAAANLADNGLLGNRGQETTV